MRMMNEFEAQVLSDLNLLKTHMNSLVGDGNGGRIAELEHRMESHEQNWQRAKGFLSIQRFARRRRSCSRGMA